MDICQKIQKARESKGLTQEELAKITRIPLSTYKNYERGKQTPPAKRLKAIALALEISTDQLIFDEKDRDPAEEMKVMFSRFASLPDGLKRHAWLAMRGVLMSYETEALEKGKGAIAA